jgi:hypothetical protein
VAELETKVASLQAAATVHEDGAPGPPGQWLSVKDAAIATKFSESALRKMVRERRVTFDRNGCHVLIDIKSVKVRN